MCLGMGEQGVPGVLVRLCKELSCSLKLTGVGALLTLFK